MANVRELWIAPVKGMRLVPAGGLELTAAGPRGDRAFHVREADGAIALTTRNPGLAAIVPAWDAAAGELTLTLPGGERVAGPVIAGEALVTRFYDGRPVGGRAVEGPFSDALSDLLGRPVTLVARDEDASGGDDHPVTLMSVASLGALAEHLETGAVDGRRFRMTITVDGVEPWEEHGWAGREVAAGEARLRVAAPTARCAVTTRDPDSGRRDLPVLRALAALHGKDSVDFGVWCDVARPGRVAVGDEVR